MKKVSSKLYDTSSETYKVARVMNDIEDIASGNLDKMIKRHVKRKVRKESNKTLNKVFKRIGL